MSRTAYFASSRLFRVWFVGFLSLCLAYSPITSIARVRAEAPAAPPSMPSIQPITHSHQEGELIVKFRPEVPSQQRDQVIESFGQAHKELRGRSGATLLTLKDHLDLSTALSDLRQLDAVIEWAEPNYFVTRAAGTARPLPVTPNDPQFRKQWALANTGQRGGIKGADVGTAAGWQTTTGSRRTVIAVIDTGIDSSNRDLVHNLWVNQAEAKGEASQDDDGDGYVDDVAGWNFVNDTNDVADDHGHGTQVSGIIAAEGNNAAGITGVMWQASLMPLKALDASGKGTVAGVIEAIDFAVAHGAAVINCSFGTGAYSQGLLEAINRASMSGTLVVAAAGNSGKSLDRAPYYPAGYNAGNLISVAATTNGDQLASFSNWGASGVQIAAPGIDVLTTQRGGGYVSLTGTSAAAPLVAGVAGLLKTVRGWVSAQTVRQSLIAGARSVPGLAGKVSSGGVVNAGGAIKALNRGGDKNGYSAGKGKAVKKSSRRVKPAVQSGGSLDYIRANNPNPPAAYVQNSTLPPAGYDDPQPTQTASFNSYYTELSKAVNAAGTAGSQPLQSVDPTAADATVGGISINLDSRNYNFSAPVLSLKGRAGVDLTLNLTYNSRVWNKDLNSNTMFFNAEKGYPGPGWRLGYGAIQGVNNGGWPGPYTNSVTGKLSYLYIAPDGTRRDLAYNPSSGRYESYDSSYLQFEDGIWRMWMNNGDRVAFQQPSTANGDFQLLPTIIKNHNGNWMGIYYRTLSNNDLVMDYIIDTAGRRIDFVYQSNRLTAVQQNRNGVIYNYALIDYQPVTVQTVFATGTNLDPATINGTNVYLPTKITYPTGYQFRFYYNSYAQLYLIEKWAPTVSGQGNERRIAYTYFTIPSVNGASYPAAPLVTVQDIAPGDCPRFMFRYEQAENWMSGNPQGYRYDYDQNGGGAPPYDWYNRVQDPLGRVYRQYSSGLYRNSIFYGLGEGVNPTRTEQVQYTQDTGVSYVSNARVFEKKVYDSSNTQQTRYSYLQRDGMWLVATKDEYNALYGLVYRRTAYDYTSYPSLRMLGLPTLTSIYSGPGTTLLAQTLNTYDETGSFTDSNGQTASYFINATPDGVIQHDDGQFGGTMTTRGNLTSVTQYSVVSGVAGSPRITKRTTYDSNGNVRAETDGAGNRTQFIVTDNYSNKPVGLGPTAAYVYTKQDPIGFRTGSQYDYYDGNVLKTFNLRPNLSTEEQVVTMSYDFADRLLQTNRPDGGYTRNGYWDNYLNQSTYQLIAAGLVTFKFQEFNGARKVRRKGRDHSNAVAGKYSGQQFIFDALGRQTDASNVIAMDGNWNPADEDAPPTGLGWIYTDKTYDEMGRPKLITRPDNAIFQYDYTGCGCAGGTTTTVTNERGCQIRTKTDFLGRLVEASELNPSLGSGFYNKVTYTYDELDRLTMVTHSDTTETKSQWRTYGYDGYARLQNEVTPEGGSVSYTYKPNDLMETVSNQRGLVATYTYNTRNLVTGVSYNDGGATPSASFGYDDWGSRNQMTDGQGTMTYTYNAYRQLQSESRTFTNLPGETYTLNYSYNLADQVTQVNHYTTSWSKNVNYGYNYAGAITGIGTNLIGTDPNTTTNVTNSTTYRGSGKVKSISYGNGRNLALGYSDQRQFLSSMTVKRTDGSDPIINQTYTYYPNGSLQQLTDNYDPAYTTTYSYDAYDRLTSASAPAFSRSYSYDEWGNLRTVSGAGGESPNYTINYATNGSGAPTNQISNVNGTLSYTYDAAGNLTNEGATVYTYDAANRLKTANPGNWLSSYYYDGDGKRVRRDVPNLTPLYYVWSSVLKQVALEVRANYTLVRAYVYMGKKLVAVQNYDGVFYWVHPDHLGSGHMLTRTDGSLDYRGEFDPHGQILVSWVAPGGSAISRMFTGYERDGATNLDNAQARMYNQNRGRFLQADPLGSGYQGQSPQALASANQQKPESLNRYSYVQNDPVNFVDPSGLLPPIDPAPCGPDPGDGGDGTPSCPGTTDCSIYNDLCEAAKALKSIHLIEYYCKLAPGVCKRASKTSAYSNCIRLCLQKTDRCFIYSYDPQVFAVCEAAIHVECFASCAPCLF